MSGINAETSVLAPQFDPIQPFNDLPGLPPQADIETHAILKQCIEARIALATLKQAGALIPNQDVLINTIPLREARDSSAIENIVTTDDKLFHHAATRHDTADPATKETLRYRAALFEGYESIRKRPLTTMTAVEICRRIRNTDIDIRATLGTALKNHATGKIIYTPPVGEVLLREKMSDWENFLHAESKIDPLISMAIGHYQFEAIHPFIDGNGRTGRTLNILYLIDKNLLDIPVLYLSRYIIENKDDYYRLLLDVTVNRKWEAWILFMLMAIERTAKWTTEKILAIRELLDDTSAYVGAVVPATYSRELVELIFIQPYCRIHHVVEAGIAKQATASKYLKNLRRAGILNEVKFGREKFFIHPKFLRLLMDDENSVSPYGGTEQHR